MIIRCLAPWDTTLLDNRRDIKLPDFSIEYVNKCHLITANHIFIM